MNVVLARTLAPRAATRPRRVQIDKRSRRFGLVAVALVMGISAGCSRGSGSTPATTAPNGEKVVSYHGVHVTVPASWRVLKGMRVGTCDGPFGNPPTVFVGPRPAWEGVPSCPGPYPGEELQYRSDGVWLQPGKRQRGASTVRMARGQVLAYEGDSYPGPVKSYWYDGVSVEIGIGPDPKVGKAILDSIGFREHAPDTKASEVCAMSKDPDAMPRPERLTVRLVLNQGDITLDPPLPSDQPSVSAAFIWKRASNGNPLYRNQLLLTRLSARLPAQEQPNGTLVPQYQNVLVWVVYSVPRSPSIPGCGDPGVQIFNSTNGQDDFGTSWLSDQ